MNWPMIIGGVAMVCTLLYLEWESRRDRREYERRVEEWASLLLREGEEREVARGGVDAFRARPPGGGAMISEFRAWLILLAAAGVLAFVTIAFGGHA